MALNLRSKVMLISVVILFGALGATSLVGGLIFSREYSASLQSRAFVIGRTLKIQLDRLLRLDIPISDLIGFHEQCREILELYPDISFARVVDSGGHVLFQDDLLVHDRVISDLRLIQDVRSWKEKSGVYESDGSEFFGILIPVFGEFGEPIASVNIGFPVDLISRKVKRMVVYSVAAAILFFAIGLALLTFLLKHWVTRPLKKLLSVIDDIMAAGVDSMRVVEIGSRDEIGKLGSAFNRMILELKKTDREVQAYAGGLENKVRQRTAELEAANRQLQLELAERLRLEAAIEQAGEAVIITDLNGIILYANSAFEVGTGLDRAKAVGSSFRSFLDGGDTGSAILETVAGGEVWSGQVRPRRQDGREIHADVTVSPIRDRSGEIINYVAVARDVTRELEIEKQLQQAQKMESIGTLAGGIAHDFNNLLSIIIGNADLALMSLDSHPAAKHLEEIQNAGQRAGDLTRQILAFSRKQMIQPQVLNLNDLLKNTRKMLGRLIGENIDLVTMLAPDLKNVKADPGQIEQVILNLAVNARDAMPGGGRLAIETANAVLEKGSNGLHFDVEPGPYIMLAVQDAGTGMDAEIRARIFEPFFTTKEKGKGTGMGLATVYGIVKQNRGSICVYSEPGQGSTFKIYLPRCEETTESAPEKDRFAPAHVGGGETILVVEDDGMLRDMTRRVLVGHGYRVLEAQNGQEAVRVGETAEGPIHLVLTDVIMPGMNVREMADRLQKMRKGVKILYVSGYTDDTIAPYGVLEEGIEFIGKPFTSREIIGKIRRVLDSALSG
jgi:PAS domain S-box-containing protein